MYKKLLLLIIFYYMSYGPNAFIIYSHVHYLPFLMKTDRKCFLYCTALYALVYTIYYILLSIQIYFKISSNILQIYFKHA